MTSGTNGLNRGLESLHVNGNTNGAQRHKPDRKASSPMMPAFMVSAPGKVIVFGEHAVVYGKVRTSPALGAKGGGLTSQLTGSIHRPPLLLPYRCGPTSM
jgi:mevalonate kinase